MSPTRTYKAPFPTSRTALLLLLLCGCGQDPSQNGDASSPDAFRTDQDSSTALPPSENSDSGLPPQDTGTGGLPPQDTGTGGLPPQDTGTGGLPPQDSGSPGGLTPDQRQKKETELLRLESELTAKQGDKATWVGQQQAKALAIGKKKQAIVNLQAQIQKLTQQAAGMDVNDAQAVLAGIHILRDGEKVLNVELLVLQREEKALQLQIDAADQACQDFASQINALKKELGK